MKSGGIVVVIFFKAIEKFGFGQMNALYVCYMEDSWSFQQLTCIPAIHIVWTTHSSWTLCSYDTQLSGSIAPLY